LIFIVKKDLFENQPPKFFEMKNIIIPLTITLAAAVSPSGGGRFADCDRLIQESTKAIQENPSEPEAYQAGGKPGH